MRKVSIVLHVLRNIGRTRSEEVILHQFGDGRASRWIQLQHICYHVHGRLADVLRRFVLHLLNPGIRLLQTRRFEGWFAHKQSVHYAADAPYVGLVRVPDLRQHFRRYVIRSATDSSIEKFSQVIVIKPNSYF